MIKVIFKCSESMNEYEDNFEFDDDVTEEEIQKAFVEWVWNEVGDRFTWYREGE